VLNKRCARAEVDTSSFRAVTEAFVAKRTRWSDGHRGRFMNSMKLDVWPVLGSKPVGEIEAIDTAKRVIGMIGQVMTFAVTLGMAKSNPAQGLSAALEDTPPTRHRAAAVHDHDTLGRILDDIWAWEGGSMAPPVLKMLALTFARPGEVRHMRWEDVKFETAIWRNNVTKMGVVQTVPLSRQALEIIDDMRQWNGKREFVFANTATGKPISDVLPSRPLEKLGWGDVQTAHGFRAVARTELVETLDYDSAIVEFQLSHRSREVHQGAYDRVTMVEKRRVMMQEWADSLDGLRAQARAKRLGIAAVG